MDFVDRICGDILQVDYVDNTCRSVLKLGYAYRFKDRFCTWIKKLIIGKVG